MERLTQIWWVSRSLPDVEDDLSVFHRIDDWRDMEAGLFFRRCHRLENHPGSVASAKIRARLAAQVPAHPAVQDPAVALAEDPEEVSAVDPTPEQIRAMWNAARAKKYPPAQYGEAQYVSADELSKGLE